MAGSSNEVRCVLVPLSYMFGLYGDLNQPSAVLLDRRARAKKLNNHAANNNSVSYLSIYLIFCDTFLCYGVNYSHSYDSYAIPSYIPNT